MLRWTSLFTVNDILIAKSMKRKKVEKNTVQGHGSYLCWWCSCGCLFAFRVIYTIGLVAALRKSSFLVMYIVLDIPCCWFAAVSCINMLADLLVLWFLLIWHLLLIKFLRMGSTSSFLRMEDVHSSSEWMQFIFLGTFSKMVISSTMKTAALHLASSSLNFFGRWSSWKPAVWLGGIGVDVNGANLSNNTQIRVFIL